MDNQLSQYHLAKDPSFPCRLRMFVVQSLSWVWVFVTPWTAMHQASLSFTISRILFKLMSTESVMPSNHLILSCPLVLLPSFPPWGSFLMSQFFASGGQSIGASTLASVLPMNIQGWFPLELTGLISLMSKGLLRVFSITTIWKHPFFSAQPFLWSTLTCIHDYWKNHSFDYMNLCWWSDISAF